MEPILSAIILSLSILIIPVMPFATDAQNVNASEVQHNEVDNTALPGQGTPGGLDLPEQNMFCSGNNMHYPREVQIWTNETTIFMVECTIL